MTIAAVDSRYAAAAQVAVEHHRLGWPTLYDIVVRLRALRRARQAGISSALDRLLEDAYTWLRILTAMPTSPAAPHLGTVDLAASFAAHATGGLDSQVGAHLQTLAELLGRIPNEAHPAAGCLEELISRYGREYPDSPPAVYLASDHAHSDALAGWLAAEELDAEVATITDLRTAPVRDTLVLLGPPARYLVSSWCPPERAAQLSRWVLTCPPAVEVHIVTWPGHGGLETDVRTFPTSTPPRVQEVAIPAGGAPSREPVWLPPLPVNERVPPRASWVADRDPVEARGVRLADDAIAFFPIEGRPHPEVVTWEGGTVQVSPTTPAGLAVGDALLFRPARSASDDELHRRADARLVDRYGPDVPAAAHAAKQELKAALEAKPRRQDPALLSHLTALLGDPGYARHVLHRLPDPEYIGPEKPGAYTALRRVLGLPDDAGREKETLLRSLRAACRAAGVEITAELVEVLHSTDGWQADVDATGCSTLNAGPLLGQLEIRAVAAIDPTPLRIGRSRLGRLVPPTAPGTPGEGG
ncbi:MAG: hypothetical protein ACYCUF_07485 [Acidimicrobiales bacterium]